MLYKLLIIGALLAAGAWAEDVTASEDCCSLEDKKELVFMWHQVWHSSYTERRVRIMKAVVQDIVAKHPGAQELLKAKGVEDLSSPQFRAYAVKVAHTFDMIINMVEEPLVLEEMIDILSDEFGKRQGIKPSYFEYFTDSLETVLDKASTCFNMGAWHRCLKRLAHGLAADIPAKP